MRLLLDTHALLWFLAGDDLLSREARLAIESAEEALVSIASLWEVAIKLSLGKLTIGGEFGPFFDEQLRDNDLHVLPLQPEHLALVARMPFHHRDPFDRLLAAQAAAERLPLVSRDAAFDAYGTQRIW